MAIGMANDQVTKIKGLHYYVHSIDYTVCYASIIQTTPTSILKDLHSHRCPH